MLFQNHLHSFPMLRVGAKAGHLLENKSPGFLHPGRGNVQLGVSGTRIAGNTVYLLEARFSVWQLCCHIVARRTFRQLGSFLFGGRFCLGLGIFDLFQNGVELLRRSLGQAFKEDIRNFQVAAKDLQLDAGAELVCEVYALGKQGCPPDGTGADVVFPRNALTGFLGGLVVFILVCTPSRGQRNKSTKISQSAFK